MSATVEQLEAEALMLTEGQRAELAERLVESLASPRNLAAQDAWLALAKRRRDELRSGQVAGIPGDAGSALVRRLVGR
jgi:putative addiction module component (TIGR02574 family)